MAGVALHAARGSLPRGAQLVARGAVPATSPRRPMHSRSSGLMEPLGKPWDYKKLGYSYLMSLIDGTTKRFRDNSKMIVVEGPPALDKSKFAKELADEFGMLYVPGWSMDDYYINHYGYDLRELDHAMTYTRNKSYDEKKFSQDPAGQSGGLDRMLYQSYIGRYCQYLEGLALIFNTGQGVVTERSPHSDWVYIEAAYRQGWISRTTRQMYHKVQQLTIDELLRPNMIIYLDAPVDVVQSKIRARAQTTHPWEKNSPVWGNTDYLDNLYTDLFKKQYLQEAGRHSYVLSYDWSEGGDTEVVAEDIERINMDYHDKYDKQQGDWRLLTEDNFGQKRLNYTGKQKWRLLFAFETPFFFADDLILTTDEGMEADRVKTRVPGSKFIYGFNTDMGDQEPFFNLGNWGKPQEGWFKDVQYFVEPLHSDSELEYGDKVRERAKEAGDVDWWKQGWGAVAGVESTGKPAVCDAWPAHARVDGGKDGILLPKEVLP